MSTIKKNRVEGPTGGAGLIRYFDVDEGGPKLSPKLVVGLVISLVLLEIMFSVLIK